MTEDNLKKITIRVPEEIHRPVRIRIAELDSTFQDVLMDLLKRWVSGELDELSDPEERRLVEEYRKASLPKRQRMLGMAAKADDLGPELMPKKKKA